MAPKKYTINRSLRLADTYLDTWFERGGGYIILYRKGSDRVLLEWRDEQIDEAIIDGFLRGVSGMRSSISHQQHMHLSAFEHAEYLGLTKRKWHMRIGAQPKRFNHLSTLWRYDYRGAPVALDTIRLGQCIFHRDEPSRSSLRFKWMCVKCARRWPAIRTTKKRGK